MTRCKSTGRGAIEAGYTPDVKVAISVPDELHAEAERLAHRLNRSRSRLYADAMREYLARHDPNAVTRALNWLCDVLDTRADPAVEGAARRRLERVEAKYGTQRVALQGGRGAGRRRRER